MSKKWQVAITERVFYAVREVEAETAEGAEEIALELFPGDDRVELLDSEIDSVTAEPEDDE